MTWRFQGSAEEQQARDEVLARLRDAVRQGGRIAMPAVGELSPFGGTCAEFQYQFEGEDDLLRLCVARRDGGELSLDEARGVAAWLLPELQSGLVWVRPGRRSHSFHLSHEDLLVDGG
jgi:hypothetical protein